MSPNDLIAGIHGSPLRGVVAVTGGGSGALEQLLATPGASATVLEALVPYSPASLTEWLGGEPERACDAATARQMAVRAFEPPRHLAPEADPRELFGLGCTASLASTRPKRGEHRAHIAAQSASQTLLVTLRFEKGRRSREEEEAATSHAVIATLADAIGVRAIDLSKTPEGIEATRDQCEADPAWTELLIGQREVVEIDAVANAGSCCLLPGSFNPPHRGHHTIARIAATVTDRPVVYELSVANVDKPTLDFIELRDRLAALAGRPVWLTRSPTFVEKARLAPGAVFAVGIDTVERIGRRRYYADDAAHDQAIRTIADLGCRFLVFGRLKRGQFTGLDAIDLPPALRDLCNEVTEDEFRVDVSSTELRSS